MTADPFETYRRLDPARGREPDWSELGPVLLDAIDERTRTMTIDTDTIAEPRSAQSRPDGRRDGPPRPDRTSWATLAAAAALVAFVVASLVFLVRRDDQAPANPPDTAAIEPAPPTRTLGDDELVYVGAWAGTFNGDLGGAGAFRADFADDGTFTTRSFADLCAMTGTWALEPRLDAVVLDGACGGRTFRLAAAEGPAELDGVWTTEDGLAGTFVLTYEPAERALTAIEQELVGEWSGDVRTVDGSQTASLRVVIADDGTMSSVSDNRFFCDVNGRWEIGPAGLLTWTGRCDGMSIRMWAPVESGVIDGEWNSSLGFWGTVRLEAGR